MVGGVTMFKRQTKGDIVFSIVNVTLLTVILFVILFPLIFIYLALLAKAYFLCARLALRV